MKIPKKQKKITKSFCLDPELFTLAKDFCEKEEVSLSQFLEFLIDQFFDVKEK